MAPPSFADPAVFPAFRQLPTTADSMETNGYQWWLLAQVKENMTFTKPTLVVSDRSGVDFAVLFEDAVDLRPWKKGSLLVLPCARRTEKKEEGKKDLVRVPEGESKNAMMIPGGWDVLRIWEEKMNEEGGSDDDDGCVGCGKEGGSKCMGCGVVKYCGKECQVKGWNDGHKKECKGLKAIQSIWA